MRSIAYLVRDKNWNTRAPVIEGLTIRQARDSFSIRYTATCHDETQTIRYAAIIEARSMARSAFRQTLSTTEYYSATVRRNSRPPDPWRKAPARETAAGQPRPQEAGGRLTSMTRKANMRRSGKNLPLFGNNFPNSYGMVS
jgi:hypothetical protein